MYIIGCHTSKRIFKSVTNIDQHFLIIYSAPGFQTRYLSQFVCLLRIEQQHLLPRRMSLLLCVFFFFFLNQTNGVNKPTFHATTQSPFMMLNLSTGQVHFFFQSKCQNSQEQFPYSSLDCGRPFFSDCC